MRSFLAGLLFAPTLLVAQVTTRPDALGAPVDRPEGGSIFLAPASVRLPGAPVGEIERLRQAIPARALPVTDLAKTESLSQNPEAYEQWVAGGGKPRRAAAEVALQMSPAPLQSRAQPIHFRSVAMHHAGKRFAQQLDKHAGGARRTA